MRVLYVSEHFWPEIGGVEVVGARLVAGLHARGHEVTVVSSELDPPIVGATSFGGVTVHRLDLTPALIAADPGRIVASRRLLTDLVRTAAPDVVHVAASALGAYWVPTLARTGVPLVLSLHGWAPDLDAGPGSMATRATEAATRITACSRATLDAAIAAWPAVAVRSSVIHAGIEHPEPSAPTTTPPTVVGVGRLHHEKGFDVLVDAWALVVSDHPTARLHLAGDGPERPRLEAQVRALGLAGAVTLLGWVTPDGVGAVLDSAAVVVVPSRAEGFGLSGLEAAVRGRAVVSTAVGGLAEALGDGTTARFVPTDDPVALARAVSALLEDPGGAAALGARARARALGAFGWPRCLDEHEAAYRRAMDA